MGKNIQQKRYKTIHRTLLQRILFKKKPSSTYLNSWTELIEKEIEKLHENKKHKKDKMNDPINEKEVQQVIKSLKNNKSTKPDKIKNKFIKNGGRELTKVLSQTFNKMFQNVSL